MTAFFKTAGESMLRPTSFFRELRPGGSIGPALVYAVIMGCIGYACAVLWNFLLPGPWLGLESAEERALQGVSAVVVTVFGLIVVPLMVPVGLFIGSLIYHGMLLLFGGPSRGFEGTFRVVSYASSPQILTVVPFCGSIAAALWGLVLTVIGLREVHGIQTGKAVAVVLVPLLLCVTLVLATVVFVLAVLPGGLAEILRHGGR